MRVQLHDISLYYEEIGSGRPILMLHGWPLDHRAMQGALEPIFTMREGWRRIYVDLPGMGQSDAPDWLTTQDQVLDVLIEFIDQIIPHERFCVSGLSYGGLLAQGLAYRRAAQIDGLMFLVPSVGAKDKQDLPPFIVMHEEPIDFTGVEAQDVNGFKGMAVVQNQAHLEAWKQDIFVGVRQANFAFLDRLNASFSFDVEHLPQPCVAPTLFLLGRQDSIVGYRNAWRVIENYPHAAFVILDRAGHCLQMEQTALYTTLVHEWLDRVEEFVRKK